MMSRLARFLIPALVVAGLFVTPTPAQAATITVTANIDTISDNNICTIREAVISANTGTAPNDDCPNGSPGLDTINFAPSVSPQLSVAPGAESTPGETGDLDVSDDLT